MHSVGNNISLSNSIDLKNKDVSGVYLHLGQIHCMFIFITYTLLFKNLLGKYSVPDFFECITEQQGVDGFYYVSFVKCQCSVMDSPGLQIVHLFRVRHHP